MSATTTATIFPTTPPPQLLLGVAEAARVLSISQRTLFDLTARGIVPCIRLGRSKRYALRDLEAAIEKLRQSA